MNNIHVYLVHCTLCVQLCLVLDTHTVTSVQFDKSDKLFFVIFNMRALNGYSFFCDFRS